MGKPKTPEQQEQQHLAYAEWLLAWQEAAASGIDFLPLDEYASTPDDDDMTPLEIDDPAWDAVSARLTAIAGRRKEI